MNYSVLFEQSMIFLTGACAIWLTQDSRPNVQRWACIVGLVGQPLWLWGSWRTGQWGVFLLSMAYAVAWARGFNRYWIGPYLERRKARPAVEPNSGAGQVCEEVAGAE